MPTLDVWCAGGRHARCRHGTRGEAPARDGRGGGFHLSERAEGRLTGLHLGTQRNGCAVAWAAGPGPDGITGGGGPPAAAAAAAAWAIFRAGGTVGEPSTQLPDKGNIIIQPAGQRYFPRGPPASDCSLGGYLSLVDMWPFEARACSCTYVRISAIDSRPAQHTQKTGMGAFPLYEDGKYSCTLLSVHVNIWKLFFKRTCGLQTKRSTEIIISPYHCVSYNKPHIDI